MSQNFNNPFGGLDWTDLQKQMLETLMNFGKQNTSFSSSGFSSGNGNQWADAMDMWWRAFKPSSSNNNFEMFNKMLEQSRMFYLLSEHFSKIFQAFENTNQTEQSLNNLLVEQFEQLQAVLDQQHNMFSWSQIVDQCEQPAQLFKNLFSDKSIFSGMPINDFSPEVKKIREKFFTMPGLGYSREMQEKMQEALRLWAHYQDNYQEFQTIMSCLNHEAMDLMRKRLMKMHKDGEKVESMRQIYHIWVDSNEKVYGEFVFTEEYSELNARLVNSLMAFKKQSHEITEDYLKSMNLPTSSSIQALERRQHELRKQVRDMQAELKAVKAELGKTQTVSKKVTVEDKKAKSEKPKTKAEHKASKKTTKKAAKPTVKSSSRAVNLNKSRKKKSEKQAATNKKSEIKNADDKGMIEIKF